MSQYRLKNLFSEVQWSTVAEQQEQEMRNEIANYNGNKLLNTDLENLTKYFEQQYQIVVPTLKEEEIVADQQETSVDVSLDQMRCISDRTKPFYVPGTLVEITIPYEGDGKAFNICPHAFILSSPRAEVRDNILIIKISGTSLTPEEVRSQIDETLSEIKYYLEELRRNIEQLNDSLPKIAREAIKKRREKLLKDQNLVASLGFPLKKRSNVPLTYTVPEIRRKIQPKPPVASTAPYEPEPELSMENYNHILKVIENMALVMERSPSAFINMDEESLRSHFLVQLNGHFEGNATGETFNYGGKTDILIRVDNKNIFIGECKFWGGQKKLTETLDQILDYSSWRDTKVAVILFNRNKNFSSVIESITPTVEAYPNYKKTLAKPSETSFSYAIRHRDDPNREMILTILAFDVPTQSRSSFESRSEQ